MRILSLLVATFLLMAAALWNQFPLIYPDVGTYIASGFIPEMPIDRPITYGLFIFVTSLGGISLWGTIFVQALMTIYVIRLFLKAMLLQTFEEHFVILVALLLTLFTGISFPVGQLIADFATPVMLLCLLLLVMPATLNNTDKKILYGLFFLTNAMHISHILLNTVLLCILGVIIFFCRKRYPSLKIQVVGWLWLLCLLGIVTMGAPLSKSSHVFRVGTLANTGILQLYLSEQCSKKSYRLCDFQDQIPLNFDGFVWEKSSPLYKIGWKESKKEFQEILLGIYTNPKYLKKIAISSFHNTLLQLQTFEVGEGNLAFEQSAHFIQILEQYCHASAAYEKSRQFHASTLTLIPTWLHNWHRIVLYGCLLGIFWGGYWHFKNGMGQQVVLWLGIGIALAILVNAWTAATFVLPQNRFGCRVIWLLPLWVVSWLFLLWERRFSQISSEKG